MLVRVVNFDIELGRRLQVLTSEKHCLFVGMTAFDFGKIDSRVNWKLETWQTSS